jgi:Tfp pilus assembly protein PilO
MSLWRRIYEERKRLVLPLLVVLVLNAAVFVVVVLPLSRSAALAETSRSEARLALATAQRQHREVKEALAGRERADQDLRRFYLEVLPRDQAIATRATNVWLQQAARADGLEFASSQASQAPVRESRLSRAQTTVALLGRYPNIRQFLHAVETAEEFIIIDRVELSESEQNQPGAGTPLNVQLLVSSYYPTETPQ